MAAPNSINWTSFSTVISAAILVGTELLGAAWASGWAIAGFFQLGSTIEIALQVLLGLLALFVIYVFVRQALKAEPVFRRS